MIIIPDNSRALGQAHRTACLAVALLLGLAAFTATAYAGSPVKVPGSADINDFSYAMNAAGEYLIAWDNYATKGPITAVSGSIAGGFGVPFRMGTTAEASFAQVGTDGKRVLIWKERSMAPTNGGTTEMHALYAASWTPGATAIAQQELVQPSENFAFDASMSMTPYGSAAVWRAQSSVNSYSTDIRYSTLAADGVFQPAQTAYQESTAAWLGSPEVNFDSAGTPSVTWERDEFSCHDLDRPYPGCKNSRGALVVANGTTSGVFDPPQSIGTACTNVAFRQMPSGAAAVLMDCPRGFLTRDLYYSTRKPGQAFSPGKLVSRRYGSSSSSLELRPDGHVVVALEQFRESTRSFSVRLAIASGVIGGPIGRLKPLTRFRKLGRQGNDPQLITGPASEPYLIWTRRGRRRIAAVTPTNGVDRVTILPKGVPASAVIHVNADGLGLAVWAFRPSGLKAAFFAIPAAS